jgi:plastocyanin
MEGNSMAGTNKNVTLKMKGEYVVAVPPKLPHVKVGDTLTFNSAYDAFKVIFKGRWPFAGKKHVVRNNKPLTFASEGPFRFLCYIGARPRKHLSSNLGHAVSSGRIKWAHYDGDGGTGSVKPPGK